jgi:ABC-type multidrug transport system ATPase subunit
LNSNFKGLDPETTRNIWECISDIKKDHYVLLTTHSMEEASVLCDRIGILVKGNLKCIGTEMSLKQKYSQVISPF